VVVGDAGVGEPVVGGAVGAGAAVVVEVVEVEVVEVASGAAAVARSSRPAAMASSVGEPPLQAAVATTRTNAATRVRARMRDPSVCPAHG
jgi:hypothetical protein